MKGVKAYFRHCQIVEACMPIDAGDHLRGWQISGMISRLFRR